MEHLILVRHGQTAGNAEQLIQGTLDIPLNDRGMQQARAVAEALSARSLDRVVSSPLARATMTATAIANRHHLPVVTDDMLRERAFGVFQGGPQRDYSKAFSDSGLLRWEYRPPQGETIPEVWARAAAALQVLKSSGFKRVVVTAHEGVNKCLILMLLGKPVEEWTAIKQGNCCINEFSFRADGSVAEFELNNTDHLLGIV